MLAGLNKLVAVRLIRASAICALVAIIGFAGGGLPAQDEKPWVAPDEARKVKNPVPATPENLEAGAKLFKNDCILCHGEKGKGDGSLATMIATKPANFTDSKLLALETDGSLFWKISEGRDPMPTWKEVLSEQERWQLVNYIRKLNADANPK